MNPVSTDRLSSSSRLPEPSGLAASRSEAARGPGAGAEFRAIATPQASLRSSVGRRVLGIAALASLALAAGCASDMPTKATRTQFSSKDRTGTDRSGTDRSGAAARADAGAPNSGSGAASSTTTEAPRIARAPRAPRITRETEVPAETAPAPKLATVPQQPMQEVGAADAPAITSAEADSILAEAARNSWAKLRANAIEMSVRNPQLLERFAPAGLVDENRGVRFVTCMAIARQPSKDLGALVAPLLSDDSESVRAAAILALSRCGIATDPSPIARMLGSNDPEIRGNAYLVLGELGNRSAAPMIRESVGRGMKLVNPLRVKLVDLAAAEALVKLGDEHEIEPIRAALFAPPEQAELTAVACDAIGRLKDEVARPMLERILSAEKRQQRSPEIRLSAAKALVMLLPAGDASARRMSLALAEEHVANPDPRVRALVASLLAEIRGPEAMVILARLIRDSDPSVQVAAAGGIEGAE